MNYPTIQQFSLYDENYTIYVTNATTLYEKK